MFEKILVCLDGSELAEQVLPYAAEEARRFCSEMTLLHVAMEPALVATDFPGTPGTDPETPSIMEQMKRERKQIEAYLEKIAVSLRKEGVKVATALLQDAPGDAIVSYAEDNDIGLIAMATHGRSGLGRAVFGSVAEHVLRNSTVPLLVVRPRPSP